MCAHLPIEDMPQKQLYCQNISNYSLKSWKYNRVAICKYTCTSPDSTLQAHIVLHSANVKQVAHSWFVGIATASTYSRESGRASSSEFIVHLCPSVRLARCEIRLPQLRVSSGQCRGSVNENILWLVTMPATVTRICDEIFINVYGTKLWHIDWPLDRLHKIL